MEVEVKGGFLLLSNLQYLLPGPWPFLAFWKASPYIMATIGPKGNSSSLDWLIYIDAPATSIHG